MARERRHKSRPRRRRGRFSGLYKLLSVLLVTAAVAGACMVFFRVNEISVAGSARYSDQQIIDVSGIQQGDNLIAIPRGKIANRIIHELPYIRSVSIDWALPDRVVLTVKEHAAVAAVSDGSRWWYISAQGRLLEQSAVQGPMRVTGLTAVEPEAGRDLEVSEQQQARLSYVLSLLSALEERGAMADCSALDCATTGVLWLDYLGFRLKMPTTGDFDYYLYCLEQIFETEGSVVSREGSGTFDFTGADGRVIYAPGN